MLRHDFRLAFRSLVRRPLLSVIAIASIALGVGFNAVIFSAVNALLLEPPAGVESGDRAVELGRTMGGQGFDTFGYPDFLALREGVAPLEEVAAWRMRPLSWGTEQGGERINGMTVSPGYFEALGVGAAQGRLFGPEQDSRGGPAVAVISHRFWQDRLGGDPEVVGRTLDLSRTAFTVIGVAAPGFDGHLPMLETQVWTPIARTELADPGFDTGIYDRWGSLELWAHTAIHVPPLSPADHVDAKDWGRALETNAAAVGRLIPMVAPLLGRTGRALFFDDARTGETTKQVPDFRV